MTRKLTPKQQRFADEYIKSGNAADAARKAGYKKNTARVSGAQNLTKLNIKKYIDEQMAEIASKRIMDAKEAVELLTRIARGEEKETVISSTPEGVYESHKEADLKTRISAVKEILKRYPGDDRLVKAQIRKAEAEARISSHKANELEGVGHVNPLLKALAKGAQQLVPKEEEDDANTTK
ncbi:terminase small subunit [Lactiplantibacillus plantarum]|uniref:terminase small subunit n=1 Tax=Lactiplantibacillus plantarum TaxID=1590 RepID=UPI001E55E8A6|nr:terminase small subunit [Lactiplantibacillus plantarum]MCC6120578.1 terminase small subunit [Lactiplantibacillus plantarum]MCW6137061.1 terminase small subunit [Lactiplantibacillus plantarum]